MPRALLDESLPPGGAAHQRKRLWDEGYAIADDADLKRTIESQRLPEKIGDALWIRQHYRAASTYGTSSRDSVETPHDLIHVLSGFPMKSLMHAAFHPLFWLHHCNIDRLYEAYLENNPDSQREFEANQERSRFVNRRKGTHDRYDEWLKPFYLPGGARGNRKFYPRHTFDIARYGDYVYDALHLRPAQAMTERAVYAVFEDVDINALPCSYTLHAFIYPTGAEATTPPLGPTIASIMDDPNYAGLGGVFAGKADVCTNCQNSDPFDVRIDVSARLKALGLSAADAVVKVVAVDEEEEYMAVDRGDGNPTTRAQGWRAVLRAVERL